MSLLPSYRSIVLREIFQLSRTATLAGLLWLAISSLPTQAENRVEWWADARQNPTEVLAFPKAKVIRDQRLQVGGIRLGAPERSLQKLGKPLSTIEEPNPNYRRVQRLIYPGITVRVADGSVVLIYTEHPRFATLDGVHVGDSQTKVKQVYGATPEIAEGRMKFLRYTNQQADSFLMFGLEKGQVKRITCGTLMD